MLCERSEDGLACADNQIFRLDYPRLRSAIQAAALENNPIFVP